MSQTLKLFDVPESQFETASVVITPVAFDATTSYGGGTVDGPSAVLRASPQVDLFHKANPEAWSSGFFLSPENPEIRSWNDKAVKLAVSAREQNAPALKEVNQISEQLNEWVYQETKKNLGLGKIAGTLGGDHSVPYGAIRAHAEKYPKMGILHIDAHLDLREAYQGFKHSHASIMFNVLKDFQFENVVAVAVRDFCKEEWELSEKEARHHYFSAEELFRRKSEGHSWNNLARDIVHKLPDEVYISFDIDGLEPHLCPNTGTPVPGGLSYLEAVSLIRMLQHSGKKIVGFDLCEVGPEEFDGNIGARILFELCVLSLTSQKNN